jgi:hypothetical protein
MIATGLDWRLLENELKDIIITNERQITHSSEVVDGINQDASVHIIIVL